MDATQFTVTEVARGTKIRCNDCGRCTVSEPHMPTTAADIRHKFGCKLFKALDVNNLSDVDAVRMGRRTADSIMNSDGDK